MRLPPLARRFYEGGVRERPKWAVIEGIFDVLCGHEHREFRGAYQASGGWEDATGVEHRAENLEEIGAAYEDGRAVDVNFGRLRSDGASFYFDYAVTEGRASARIQGPPDEVEEKIKTVAEVFPLQRRVVFISWSGKQAREIADGLRDILLSRMPRHGEVFLSSSMAPGTPPLNEILDNLQAADAHLAVITPESAKSAWVIWETSASWARGKPVVPVFVGIQPREVPGPLPLLAQGVPVEQITDAVATVLEAVEGSVDVGELFDELESRSLTG